MPQDTTMVLAQVTLILGAVRCTAQTGNRGIAPRVRCTPRAAAARRAAPEQLRIATIKINHGLLVSLQAASAFLRGSPLEAAPRAVPPQRNCCKNESRMNARVGPVYICSEDDAS